MHIAFASEYDPLDVASWSGTPRSTVHALEAAGGTIESLGPLRLAAAPVGRLRQIGARMTGHRHLLDRDLRVLRAYARQLERRIRASRPDVVLAVSTIPVAYLECEPPIAIWTDATFDALLGFYPEFSRLTKASVRRGDAAERSALQRMQLGIYASDWAARSARDRYSVPEAKLRVIPYGPNLTAPSHPEAGRLIARRAGRLGESCRLLFVGMDWTRKGGAVAVAVARELNERGVAAELTIVGNAPAGERFPSYVRPVGPISKSTPDGERRLAELYAQAHFFVLPTRAEASAVVFAEASAFGVPSLAPDVGGVKGMMSPGGTLMRAGAPPSDYVEVIATAVSDRRLYEEMATAVLEDSQERLNWTTAGRAAMRSLEALVQPSRATASD
jgi:glycosyltransferase involved in cell wall biosynthesis